VLKLLLAFLIPIFTIVAIPFAGLALMYDGSTIDGLPVNLYTEDSNALEMIYEEIDYAIEDVKNDVDKDLEFTLHQDIINTAIFNMIRDESFNPNYLPTDDCLSSECQYIFEEIIEREGEDLYIRFIGVWVDLGEERVTLNTAVEVQYGTGFTYRTTIKTRFIVQDNVDDYHLEFDGFNIGNLPLPQGMFSFIFKQVDNLTNINFNSIEEGVAVGDLDLKNLSYNLPKEDIRLFAEKQGEEPIFDLIGELVGVVSENRLLTFLFEDEQFTFTFGLALLRNEEDTTIPEYLKAMQDTTGKFNPIAFNPETHLTNRFEEFVFNMALTGNNEFRIKERTLNQVLYHNFEGFESTRFTHTYTDTENRVHSLTFGLDGLWFNINESTVVINGLFSYDSVKILVELEAIQTSDNPDLFIYDLSMITIGRDQDERDGDFLAITRTEAFKNVLADLGDIGFGHFTNEGLLVISSTTITDFFETGTVEGNIQISSIDIKDGAIAMDIDAPDDLQTTLDSYSDAVNDVFKDDTLNQSLNEKLTPEQGSKEEETINQITAIQEKLNNDEPITSEDVEILFDSYDAMNLQSQMEFIETFESFIDPDLISDFQEGFKN